MFRRFPLCPAKLTAAAAVAQRCCAAAAVPADASVVPHGSNAPGAKMYISPEGWRVYTSPYPSVMDKIQQNLSLYRFMVERWARTPDRLALVDAETKEQLTFQQLQDTTDRFAQVLYHHYNVRKGDVVCILTLNNVYYPVVAFSALRLGAVLTTSAAITTAEGLSHQLEASKAKVIITTHAFRPVAEAAAHLVRTHTGATVLVLLEEDLLQLEAPAIPSSYTAMEEAGGHDVVILPFSSGTTGAPKGTQLTNRNLTASILTISPFFPMSPETDKVLNVMPFFHIYGFSPVLCRTLAHNVPLVSMSKYSADTYLKAVQEFKATIAFIAPPIAVSLVHRLESPSNTYDFSSMNSIVCGAAPLSEDTTRRLVAKAPGLVMGQGWGMTEMSPTVVATPRYAKHMGLSTVGIPLPDHDYRIVRIDDSQQSGADKSAGIDAEEGKEGEIWLRGPQMMKGYLKQEDTAKCMHDGWYRTGDIGYVDERKLLYISGRLKELIKYKGFQVSPPEVEAELIKHPWVKDCIVLGVPDQQDISFENPRALVVLVDNLPASDAVRASDEIYRYMMRKMPPHKRLHGGVRIVDEIMKNATGKLMRRQQRTAELEYLKEAHV